MGTRRVREGKIRGGVRVCKLNPSSYTCFSGLIDWFACLHNFSFDLEKYQSTRLSAPITLYEFISSFEQEREFRI